MAVPCSSSSSVRFLQLELKKLQEEPVEGFRVRLVDDSNLFVWEVAIFGPPETLYEGGYYKVKFLLSFFFLCEYRRMNIMYCNNCYPPLPVVNMFYAAEDMTILLALKQTMMFVILLLFCYTRTCTDCLFFAFSLLFHILCKLRLTTF